MIGDALEDAIRYAQAAAALACTRLGAQAAIPKADEMGRQQFFGQFTKGHSWQILPVDFLGT